MNEVDFFAEQDRRMNLPDEDVDQYIQARLPASRRKQGQVIQDPYESPFHPPGCNHRSAQPPEHGVSRGLASHSFRNLPASEIPRKRSLELNPAGTCNSAEMDDEGKTDSQHGSFPVIPSAARCTKRRKTTQEYSEHTDRSFDASSGSTRSSRLVPPGTSDQNGVSSSTGLLPLNEGSRVTNPVRAQTVHSTDIAASVMERDSEFSTHVPHVSPPINSPVTVELSPLPISTRHNAADLRFDPTTFDGHGTKCSESLQSSSRTVPEDGVPKKSMIVTRRHSGAPSSPRSTCGSHEAGCIQEGPVHGVPAAFDTAAVSKATQASKDSHVLPSVAQPSSSNILSKTELKSRKPANIGRRTKKVSATSKQVKDGPKLITPLEYAQKLQSCIDIPVKRKTNYLKGKCIFYVGGDMMYASTTTRGRMDYIVKHGGTLAPKYDPTMVTHIVTDAGVHHTLKALSLRSLSDIPDNIPTVTWDWVVSGHRRERILTSNLSSSKLGSDADTRGADERAEPNEQLDFEFMHAAFSERIDAGCSWENTRRGKQGGKADGGLTGQSTSDHGGYISHISNFSQGSAPTQTEERNVPLTVLPPLPLDFKVVGSRMPGARVPSDEGKKTSENKDPLSEYYAQARADLEAQWDRDVSDSDDGDDDLGYPQGPVPRRGFACDIKEYKPTTCINQHIVDKLEELRELHKAKSSEDDRWRAYSYGKCIPALRNYPKPIQSFSEARSIRGVGEKTALKIMEIVNTGDLRRIRYENTEDVASTRVFQGIYGVGRYTAFTWFASGLRTLDDVRAGKCGLKLSTSQEIGLKFYDDLNSRMPREEASRIFEMIKPIALAIDEKLFIEIMGSYRRGKADCGDIDILITRPTTDGKTHQGVLRALLERLHVAGIITEDLAVPDDFSGLELVYHGLCKLPESGAKRRRIDFLCVPWVYRGAALLYYTGDDIFNRAMRLKANKHGYSLNQRGLYAGVVRDPRTRQKISEGRIIASETEEEIFKILGVPWQEPHERVRGQ